MVIRRAFQHDAFDLNAFQDAARAPGQPIVIAGRQFRAIFNGLIREFDSMAALQSAVASFEQAAREQVAARTAELAKERPRRKQLRQFAERIAPEVELLTAPAADQSRLAAEIATASERIRQAYESGLRAQLEALNEQLAPVLQADEDEALMALEW
jgi:hypothetical protein